MLSTMIPKMLTNDEAADYLGVKPQTLTAWRHAKRYPDLRYVKIGDKVKYRLADLEAWIESRVVGTAAE